MNFSVFLNRNLRKLPKMCVNFSIGYLVKVWHAKFHVLWANRFWRKNPSCAYNGNCLKKLSVVMNSFKKWLDFFFFVKKHNIQFDSYYTGCFFNMLSHVLFHYSKTINVTLTSFTNFQLDFEGRLFSKS